MAITNENPFSVGTLPLGEMFADHKELIQELLLDITGRQNLIIYGPRRIGKTSLIYELFSHLREEYNYQTVIIDLFANVTIERIAGKIFRDLAGNVSKAYNLAMKALKIISITTFGDTLELAHTSSTDLLIQTLNYVKSESEKGKKILIVFDEFQEMEKIDPDLMKLLRSQIQIHKYVNYIFTGSNQRLIDMFIDHEKPFYKFGKLIHLQKPEFDEVLKFIQERFENTKITITYENVHKIITITKNYPYSTFLLCQEIWLECKAKQLQTVPEDMITNAVTKIILSLVPMYQQSSSKFTNNQKLLLIIIANKEPPYSKVTLNKYKLALSTVTRSIESLVKQEFLWKENDNLELIDPFFELWIQERYAKLGTM